MTETKELTQFLNFILTGLAGEGNFQISQEVSDDGHLITYRIELDSSKAGYVIGKQGRTINAIRRLLQVKAAQVNQKVYLQIVSDNPSQEPQKPVDNQEVQAEQSINQEATEAKVEESSKTDKQVDELAELLEV